jgi:hypothetical protein
MEGVGVLTVLALLLIAPVEWWQARAQKRRFLSPHELNLRRATQPLGVLALLGAFVWLFGVRTIGGALAPVLRDPSANWLPAAPLGALLLYGVCSFIAGASHCWGVRSDRMLPVWAFFKLALGAGGLMLLLRNDVASQFVGNIWMALILLGLNATALWWTVTGGARLLLLTVGGGGNALATVGKHLKQRNAPLRPARRSWWRLWW